MALIGNIVVGMQAQTGRFDADMKKAGATVAVFEGQVQKTGAAIGKYLALGAGLVGAGITAGIIKAASAASDLKEQLAKAGVVFADQAGQVEKAADEMAARFGIPKREFLDGANSIGLLGEAAGQSKEQIAKLAIKMTTLGANLSSRDNISNEEAIRKISAGLAGEAEPLRRSGVLLDEAAVKAEAAAMGIAKLGAELSQAQKVMARASLIEKGLVTANGDLERSMGNAAFMARAFKGRLENLGADVGMAIEPATRAVQQLANLALEELNRQILRSKASMQSWAEDVSSSSGAILVAFRFLGTGLGAALDLFDTLRVALQMTKADAMSFAAVMAEMASTVAETLTSLGEHVFGPRTENAKKQLEGLRQWAKQQRAAANKAQGEARDAFLALEPSRGIEAFFNRVEAQFKAAQEAAKKAGGAIADGMKGAKPAVDALGDAAAKLSGKVQDLVTKLKEQIATFGMSNRAAEVHALKLKGAAAGELNEAGALAEQLDRMEKAKKITEEMETPLEKYQKGLKELRELVEFKEITPEVAQRKAAALNKEFVESSTKAAGEGADHGPKLAAALTAGSQEAYSALVEHASGGGDDRLVTVARQQQVIQQQQLLVLRQLLMRAQAQAGGQPIGVFQF